MNVKLDEHRRLVLTLIIAAAAVSARAQEPGREPKAGSGSLRFEVASVRPTDAATRISRTNAPGRFRVTGFGLVRLLSMAYGIGTTRIVAPEWTLRARFDIDATMPAGATSAHEAELLRRLLEERFSVRARREVRSIDILSLVRTRTDGRLGPQLVQVQRDCAAEPKLCFRKEAPGEATFRGVRWEQIKLAAFLEEFLNAVVVDQTGLSGQFDLTLAWQPGLPADAGNDRDQRPIIQTALPEQLGLKLEKRRGETEVLVIDQISMPSPN